MRKIQRGQSIRLQRCRMPSAALAQECHARLFAPSLPPLTPATPTRLRPAAVSLVQPKHVLLNPTPPTRQCPAAASRAQNPTTSLATPVCQRRPSSSPPLSPSSSLYPSPYPPDRVRQPSFMREPSTSFANAMTSGLMRPEPVGSSHVVMPLQIV